MFATRTFLDLVEDVMSPFAVIVEPACSVEQIAHAEQVQFQGFSLRDDTIWIMVDVGGLNGHGRVLKRAL